MTEKELLYLEDAIGHEKNIIRICSEFVNNLSDSNLISFVKEQINSHKNIENNLMTLLKEKTNE